ncbi:MAG: hypothetical protein IJL07_08650 [Lachnospiraceae bacterium]|nr:hypothetical protein [Lachnospiraceae bacterium]
MKHLTGTERFNLCGKDAGISLADFWSWAYSDLLNNTSRGILSEFLVLSSLYESIPEPRQDWMPFDVTSPSGRRIEVKSSAYLQSWTEDCYSRILFDIAPKKSWTPEQGISPVRKRSSDIYAFCVYTALSKDSPILDLSLWDFYILPTSVLDLMVPDQKTIGLQSLLKLCPIKADYDTLGQAIESIKL